MFAEVTEAMLSLVIMKFAEFMECLRVQDPTDSFVFFEKV